MFDEKAHRHAVQEALEAATSFIAGLDGAERAAINRQADVLRAVLAAGGHAAEVAMMLVGAEHAARQMGGVTWH
ncbi:MAG: hypothetical protein IKH84_06045 [Ottowia sp.]|nr:hypothetical protein [Ottowia sp.]